MQQNLKFAVLFLCVGILIGCAAAFGGMQLFSHQKIAAVQPTASAGAVSDIEAASDTGYTAGTGSTAGTGGTALGSAQVDMPAPAWARDTVYTGGDKIVYQGGLYRARWWTQGETPQRAEEGNVWEYLGEAAVSSLAPDNRGAVAAASASPDGDNTGEASTQQAPPDTGKKARQPRGNAAQNFRVVAYYPSWVQDGLSKVRFDIVTHVNYAFAIPTADGGLRPLENPALAKSLVDAAHSGGAKAMLAVGGWSYNDTPLEPTFRAATDSPQKIEVFADKIVQMCDLYGFDGVDMDWEHPRLDDASMQQYEALMTALSEKLHAEGKLLSAAVLSGATPDGTVYYDAGAHTDKVLAAVDWINVMAYDGGDGPRHSTYEFAVSSARYWHETRALPAEKVVLGIPFYARPSWASYEVLLQSDSNADQSDTILYNGMQAYYNGVDTVKKKTKYARENLGGVMIWEITQDTPDTKKSLLTAIAQESQES